MRRTYLRLFVCTLSLGHLAGACGDSGGTDTDGEDTGSTSGETTEGDSSPPGTTDDPSTTAASGSSGGSSSNGDDGSGSGTADTGATSTADGTDSGGATTCAELGVDDCDAANACVWVGNPNNGSCLDAGPEACPELMAMQACTQHPDCTWDNQAMTCSPSA
jgi:hypothetical protein